MSILRLNRQPKFSIYRGPVKVIQISVVGMSFMKCRHVLDHLPPMKRIMNLTLTKTHMTKENSSKKHVFPKKRFKNRSTPPQNIEVDNDSESDFTPEPEQEEPQEEEATAADDLSMLERLRKGGLPHDDAFINDDDEHVITDSDDDDAFINDDDEHVITDNDY